MNRLTFPFEANVGGVEIVTHFATGDAFDGVHSFEGVDRHAVDLFFAFVHLHFTVFGKELPNATFASDFKSSVLQLLQCYTFNLITN